MCYILYVIYAIKLISNKQRNNKYKFVIRIILRDDGDRIENKQTGIFKLSGRFMPVILYTLYHTYILYTLFWLY